MCGACGEVVGVVAGGECTPPGRGTDEDAEEVGEHGCGQVDGQCHQRRPAGGPHREPGRAQQECEPTGIEVEPGRLPGNNRAGAVDGASATERR